MFNFDLAVPRASHTPVGESIPRRGRFSDRPVDALIPADTKSYTPAREVWIDDTRIDADRDVTVNCSEKGYSTATVKLWNLSTDTWQAIDRSKKLEIYLGWDNDVERVFIGKPLVKRPERRGGDIGYWIKARGRSSDILSSKVTRSYGRTTPHTIVEDVALHMPGVAPGFIAHESQKMDRNYVITGGKDLSDWLDDLAEKATEQTDQRWVWYLDRDRIYFHPRTTQSSDIVTFSGAKSVRRATPAGVVIPGAERSSYEIVARCEPITRRSVTCRVEATDAIESEQLYRVAEYHHESGTTTGRHHTTMLLDPIDKTVDEVWTA